MKRKSYDDKTNEQNVVLKFVTNSTHVKWLYKLNHLDKIQISLLIQSIRQRIIITE